MTSDIDVRRRPIMMTDAVGVLGFDDGLAFEWVCALADSFEALPPWARNVILDGEREVEERRVSDPKWYAVFIEGDYDPWDLDGVVPVWCDACDWEGTPIDVLPRRGSDDDRRARCPECGEIVRLTLGWSFGSMPRLPHASWLRAVGQAALHHPAP